MTVKIDIVFVIMEEEEIETYELNKNLEIVVNVETEVSIMESVDVKVDIFRLYWSGLVGNANDGIVIWILELEDIKLLEVNPDTLIEFVNA